MELLRFFFQQIDGDSPLLTGGPPGRLQSRPLNPGQETQVYGCCEGGLVALLECCIEERGRMVDAADGEACFGLGKSLVRRFQIQMGDRAGGDHIDTVLQTAKDVFAQGRVGREKSAEAGFGR